MTGKVLMLCGGTNRLAVLVHISWPFHSHVACMWSFLHQRHPRSQKTSLSMIHVFEFMLVLLSGETKANLEARYLFLSEQLSRGRWACSHTQRTQVAQRNFVGSGSFCSIMLGCVCAHKCIFAKI